MSDHIGVAGNAMYRGIPNFTLSWAAGAYSLGVFNSADKANKADVKRSKNNQGQTIEMNRTDKRVEVKVAAKPIGANQAAALAIADNLPQEMDLLTVTATAAGLPSIDSSLGSCECKSATAKWSPEGELTVDIEYTLWLGQTFVAFS